MAMEIANNLPDKIKTVGLTCKLISSFLLNNRDMRKKVPFAASFDVTNKCNLACRHCYLRDTDLEGSNLNSDGRLEKLREIRKTNPQLQHMTFVGGEPLLEKPFLRKAVNLFPFSWIVTNGTIPIDGEWPSRCAFNISIDGTKEIHDNIRRLKNGVVNERFSVYEKAKANTNTATAPVHIHTVINKENAGCLQDLLAEWKRDTKAKGFVFSFQTPQRDQSRKSGMSESDEKLYLEGAERRAVVDNLLKMKKSYGDFILMTENQIKYYLAENSSLVYGRNCLVPNFTISFESDFKQRKLCVMGDNMDCDKCGCIVPTILYGFKKLDLGIARHAIGTLL